MKPSDDKQAGSGSERRRGVVRTALILAGVVFAIYLFFIGRAAVTYFGS